MQDGDSLTVSQLLGVSVWLVALLIVPVSMALALWLRQRYVKAVIRLQSGAAPAPAAQCDVSSTSERVAAPLLQMVVRDVRAGQKDAGSANALRVRRKVLRAQFICGLLFWWAALACVYVALVNAPGLVEAKSPAAAAESDWVGTFGWVLLLAPSMVAWAMQAGVAHRYLWSALGVVAVVLTAVIAIDSKDWRAAALVAAVLSGMAMLISVLLSVRMRGAGPTLVAALSLGAVLWLALIWLTAMLLPDGPEGSPVFDARGLAQLAWLIVHTVAALGAAGGTLFWIARRYEAKAFSEVQLAFSAYWGLVALLALGVVLLPAFMEVPANVAGPVFWLAISWLAFGAWLKLWLRGIARRAPPSLGALLLLRVFKGAALSEAFMDRFLSYWRFAAPVWMIGGADLAGANMEPDEFFALIRRRLGDKFLLTTEQIPARIARLDAARDPDARFRVDELFCAEATWKPAVLALIARAAVVVLDLREYNPRRAGTRYEIFQLMNLIPLDRVVVLIGATDDEAAIGAELQAAWSAMDESSPNRRHGATTLGVLRLGRDSVAEIRALVIAIAQATARATASSPAGTDSPGSRIPGSRDLTARA
jgi:hypothetical protein